MGVVNRIISKQLPYLKSRQSLAEKLLGLISENQQDDLVLLNQILIFEGTNPKNPRSYVGKSYPNPSYGSLFIDYD